MLVILDELAYIQEALCLPGITIFYRKHDTNPTTFFRGETADNLVEINDGFVDDKTLK